MSTDIESRIASLGIDLPTPPAPQGSYVPVVRTHDLLFCSGVLPMRQGELVNPGIVGSGVTLEEAQEAARVCVANLLANVKAELGTLDRVERFVRLGGFVAASADFTAHPEVINAASNLLAEIFGDAGRHARAAVGVASLPRNACVEIEAVVAVRP
ncbi:MAG: RidA family protein [Actinomycetota bacterium]|nr:RidA family protein [Actinomycetota bacterium]